MNYLAAIHVLKGKLQLSEDDYRGLLAELVSKRSCAQMTAPELAVVFTHLDKQARRLGVQTNRPPQLPAACGHLPPEGAVPCLGRLGAAARRALEKPQVRKLKAMWYALAEVGAVARPASAAACTAAVGVWAKRQSHGWKVGHLDALRFADGNQLARLIEEMKAWGERVKANVL